MEYFSKERYGYEAGRKEWRNQMFNGLIDAIREDKPGTESAIKWRKFYGRRSTESISISQRGQKGLTASTLYYLSNSYCY